VIHVPTSAVASVCKSHAKLMCLRFTFHYACLSTHSQSEYIQLSAKCIRPSSVSWETVHRRAQPYRFGVSQHKTPGVKPGVGSRF